MASLANGEIKKIALSYPDTVNHLECCGAHEEIHDFNEFAINHALCGTRGCTIHGRV